MRTFAFCGFWSETARNVAATLEPGCGGIWRGERQWWGGKHLTPQP